MRITEIKAKDIFIIEQAVARALGHDGKHAERRENRKRFMEHAARAGIDGVVDLRCRGLVGYVWGSGGKSYENIVNALEPSIDHISKEARAFLDSRLQYAVYGANYSPGTNTVQ